MAIDKDLNISPYYDDYSESDKFHRVLFKPAVPVQARELTQMQTILQNQIERMGEFNFKEGSVIKGCPFTYDNKLKYIKLMDKRVDGQVLNTAQFAKGQYAINQANVIFQISDKSAGYEATTPDLNTIYGKYIQSHSGTTNAEFAVDETLTIYNGTTTVNAAAGNTAVTRSAIGASYSNSDTWSTNSLFGSGATGNLVTDANGSINTFTITANGSGYKITELVSNGIPLVITTSTGSGGNASINTLAAEYQVKAANATFSNALGDSYQFTVGDGVIYQKGHFVQVDEQNIIIDKYTNRPDQRSVAFDTVESTVNSSADVSLLDNASGYNNENAPGADRLKLSANLVVNTTTNIESTNNALKLVSWENGQPVRINQKAQLSVLGKEIAQRTAETQGDYVVNPFTITSESFDANTIALSISSGVAYVGGNRFELSNSARKLVDKATDTITANSQSIPFNYGRSVTLNNYLGDFGSDKSPTIYLLDTAYGGLTSNTTLWRSGEIPVANGAGVLSANVTAAAQDGDSLGGTDLGVVYNSEVIGSVKLHNVKQISGTQGFANAEYKAYLGAINMRAGKKFADAKAMWIGTNTVANAIADIVLTDGIAKVKDNKQRTFIFNTGAKAVKTITDSQYPFRAKHQGDSNTLGHIAISNTFTDTTFVYGTSGTLSTTQKEDLIVVPGNTVTSANISTDGATPGALNNTITANTTVLFGSGATTAVKVGDTLRISGGGDQTGNTVFRKVDRVINSTAVSVTPGIANSDMIHANNGLAIAKAFLKNVPVNMASEHAVATLSNSGKTLTIDIGAEGALSAAANLSVYATEKDSSPTRKSKKLQANVFVHINCANNGGGATGPWDLGLADIRKIKNVYHGYDGTGGVANTTPPRTGTTDYSNNFILDTGQQDGFYGLGKMILDPDTTLTVNSLSRFTVEVDCFLEDVSASGAAGFYTIDSYPIDDADSPAANTIKTQDIPVFKSPISGKLVDLRNSIDIRPVQNNVSNTAGTANTTANAGVTLNPNNATVSGWKNTGALRLGQVDENFIGDNEYYLRRIDKLEISTEGALVVNKGVAALRPQAPITKNDNMQLGIIQIPPYPSLDVGSAQTAERPDLAIRMNNKQVQRLTQKQINNLQQRVGKLEYYTSLNMLEKAASDLVIGSTANSSLDRFKNGILVDDFQTMTIGDLSDREFKAGHDKGRKFLQPRFNPFPIKVSVSKLRGCRQTGDSATIDYKQRPLFKQGKGTRGRRIAGRDWQFTGTMRLYPDYDGHVDTTKPPKIGIQHPIDTGPIVSPPGRIGGCFPPHYPTIEHIDDNWIPKINFDPLEWINTEALFGHESFSGIGGGMMGYGIGVVGLSPSHERRVGDYQVDISIIGKMRDKAVYFHAKGLRPNMKHYFFFDGDDVTAKIRGGSVANNAVINSTKDAESSIRLTTAQGQSSFTSDASGEIAGVFYLPSNSYDVGSRKFAAISESSYANFSSATSRAAATYNAFNFEIPHIEHPTPPNPRPVVIAPEFEVHIYNDDVDIEIEDVTDYIDPPTVSIGPDEVLRDVIPFEMRDTVITQIGLPELPVNPTLPVPRKYMGGGPGVWYNEMYQTKIR